MSHPKDVEALLNSVEEMHRQIRKVARDSIKMQSEDIAAVTGSGNGDVSYGIDTRCERVIDGWFTKNPPEGGAVVISEGLGTRVYPAGLDERDARWRIIIDPLDGTRHIMYDNRSAWVLTGIAENRGRATNLGDICAAIQTEVPTTLQDKGVVIKAYKGQGAALAVYDLTTGKTVPSHLSLRPSGAETLENGFCIFPSYFAGTKGIISELEERVLIRLYGEPAENTAPIFSEQYICTAGHLYMLMTGKYRAVVEIRALLGAYQHSRGKTLPLCVHPYDLCTALIARECGCQITDGLGGELIFPLDLDTNCSWAGYANAKLYGDIHPIVLEEMKTLGIL